ncbi:MAG: zinc-binding alcohol dehydrogenase [Fidelibacterota bacterium]|nr:MAG: zinc-binding alcohol dehydrogenase [Candidatus Neomarinimicrobiota bacterium]
MQARQIFFPRKGEVEFEVVELPEVGDDQVLVEALCSVISPGTELAWLHALPNTPGEFPIRIAYCSCGRVVQKGKEVRQFTVGQMVVYQALHATAQVMDRDKVIAVPEGVLPEEAAALPLVGIALQGIRKSQVTIGESVAVLGLGLIGNLAGQLAHICGAIYLVGIDPDPWRRELALSCGFDAAVASVEEAQRGGDPQLEEAGLFEVVIEAAGVPEAVVQAFELASPFGRVILLGSIRGRTEQVDFYTTVHRKGLTVIGAHNARRPQQDEMFGVKTMRTDMRLAMSLLAGGRIKVGPMISDRVSAEEASKAYQRLWSRREKLVTIALDWSRIS